MSKLHDDLALEFLAYQIVKRINLDTEEFYPLFHSFMNEYHKGFVWCGSRTDKVILTFHNVTLPNFKEKLSLNKPQGAKFARYINKFTQK